MALPNIFLIGPMGSGKSAVGKQLAKMLRREFHDSDAEIEARTGVDIPFIFEKEGEAGFRRREREVIAELTAREEIVLATGGARCSMQRTAQYWHRAGWSSTLKRLLSSSSSERGSPTTGRCSTLRIRRPASPN
jgi:shikimate kinase